MNTLRPGRLLLVLLRNRNVKEKRSFVYNMALHADKRVGPLGNCIRVTGQMGDRSRSSGEAGKTPKRLKCERSLVLILRLEASSDDSKEQPTKLSSMWVFYKYSTSTGRATFLQRLRSRTDFLFALRSGQPSVVSLLPQLWDSARQGLK